MASPAPPSPARPGDPPPLARLSYQPGLDGLRALALLAIFVVHADIGMASGGFLAVSTFFTLSGFLITTLLLSEHATSGRIDLRAFWARRARRLLPASLVAIAGIAVATAALGDATQLGRLRADALGSLLYVANWRFIAAGDRYGARFESESPLLHFWSLAIEEQFYVVFPLVVVAGLLLARRWRPALPALLGGLLLASLATGVLLSGSASTDRLYFGTDIRAAELLVGALAAWWWTPRRQVGPRLAPVLSAASPVLLVVMGLLISTADPADRGWYRGGLLLYAAVTATVVVGVVQPGSRLGRVLAWRPLVWIGVTSYGAYLVHWPVFVWLRSSTSLPGGWRLVIGTVASLALATLSYLVVEHPVRRRRRLPHTVTLAVPTALVALALVTPSVVTLGGVGPSLEGRAEALEQQIGGAPVPEGVPTVAFFGDSTAVTTALGLAEWREQRDEGPAVVQGWAELGCSILSPVTLRARGQVITTNEVCTDYAASWEEAASQVRPDLAVVQVGPWELSDVRLSEDDEFLALGDAPVDDAVRMRLAEAVGALRSAGVRVALLTTPPIVSGAVGGRAPESPFPESDPDRAERFNALLAEVAATDDDVVVVDLGAELTARPDLSTLRPDGIHLSSEGAVAVASWLGPALAAVAEGDPPPQPGG